MGSRLQRTIAVGVLASVLVTAGCGTDENPPTGPATPLPSYLARYPPGRSGAVYFLQWQRREDSVDGTLTVVVPSAPGTSARTQPVSGEIDGRRVTLDVGTQSPQRWNGRRVGPAMAFTVELGDGTVQKLRFVRATLADYRRAVG